MTVSLLYCLLQKVVEAAVYILTGRLFNHSLWINNSNFLVDALCCVESPTQLAYQTTIGPFEFLREMYVMI